VPDLYVVGTELELLDGQIMWLQVMNPFERDEAQHDASVARSRLTLALRDQPDSEELAQVRSMFVGAGRDAAIEAIMEAKKVDLFLEIMDELKTEEEWRERVEVLQRTADLSTVPTEAERTYLIELQEAFALEVAKRLESAIMVDREVLEESSDDVLYEKYKDWFLEQRGGVAGMGEYRMTEMWYSCRACVGVKGEDGVWDHSECEGHQVRVFESKDEVRHLPEALQARIIGALMELEMSEREAKN
jgi:hypothetical protein